MIGKPLTRVMLNAGYKVVHLSRSEGGMEGVATYQWDPAAGTIDQKALEGVQYIIHLAGTGIVDKPWSADRKQEIIDSRVKTAELLHKACSAQGIRLKGYISASAIGWYPLEISKTTYQEDAPPGTGYLAQVCSLWEASADSFESIADRVVKLRIGLVLARDQGALKQVALPVKYYMAAGLGSGDQAMSWIHLDDVCRMFRHSVEHDLKGVYNAVGPDTITNQDFMQILADVMEKPLILPNVPEFMIRMLFGQKSDLVLKGVRLSSNKILKTGFEFDYPTLNSALMHIYSN